MDKDTFWYQNGFAYLAFLQNPPWRMFFLDFEKISFMMIWDAKHEF